MTDEKPTAPKPSDKQPPAKVRDVIPVAKLQLRSDLTVDWPGYPAGTRTIAASEQVRIEYHTAAGFYVVSWRPRPGGTEKPFIRYIPRDWASMEPL